MDITNEDLKKILVEDEFITLEQFNKALEQSVKKHLSLIDYLIESGTITDNQLGQLIASYKEFNFVDLDKEPIDNKVLNLIPESVAKNRGVICFAKTDNGFKVGMTDPGDLEIVYFLEKKLNDNVIPFYITRRSFDLAVHNYRASLEEEFRRIVGRLKKGVFSREYRDDATVRIVDILIQHAYQSKVSDIHIEPYRSKVMIRFRIDGVMYDVLEITKDLLNSIVTRIKILAKMRTDEHMAAQDGKLRYSVSGENLDVRVSIVPVTDGENIVMRLLSSKNRKFTLDSLGFGKENKKKLRKFINHPHGMILVTGPTGSGKTTTLYAVMKILNKREVHVSTIEDPVEYNIEGISQIQVNNKTGLTFANGLRALVRQDPDIIMVGEIRDSETADIAVNSAMTGHLVLSTLHTNNAATTLPRLLEMEVEPFLVASTVNIAIAQRLVRNICTKCRTSYTITREEKEIIKGDDHLKKMFKGKKIDSIRLYKGTGCKVCGDTGYSGRIGIFEVLVVENNIKDLIIKRVSSDVIMEAARKNGMETMFEDGVRKVLSGVTTLEEVMRVTRD